MTTHRTRADVPLPSEAAGKAPGRGRLTGRRILVIGAGSMPSPDAGSSIGNGRAIAVLAAREGARVMCADISLPAANETVSLIQAEGGAAFGGACDVSDADQCAAIVGQAREALNGLDGIVYNVGILNGAGVADTKVSDFDRAFAINVRGGFAVAAAALPHMQPGSSIVFISSTAVNAPGPPNIPYSVTKGALEGYARNVAAEYAPQGVRCNIVTPHVIDTPLGRTFARDNHIGDLAQWAGPMGRLGTPWEVAYATIFLLSDESSYTTGHVFYVDGGFRLKGVR